MLRWVFFPITTMACLLAGVLGAMAGAFAVVGWPGAVVPLFFAALRIGLIAGGLGAVLAAVPLFFAEREWLWRVVMLSAGFTLLLSSAAMWWIMVTALA
jgi:hypothetical protein